MDFTKYHISNNIVLSHDINETMVLSDVHDNRKFLELNENEVLSLWSVLNRIMRIHYSRYRTIVDEQQKRGLNNEITTR